MIKRHNYEINRYVSIIPHLTYSSNLKGQKRMFPFVNSVSYFSRMYTVTHGDTEDSIALNTELNNNQH